MAGSIKQGLLRAEPASKEQESKNPSAAQEIAKSEVQPQKVIVDKELLHQIGETLKDQMSELINKIEELAEKKDNQLELAVVPVSMIKVEDIGASPYKDRKRKRPNTRHLGELYFSFELLESCIPKNIDLDKVLALTESTAETSDGKYATPKLSVTERLQNWNMLQKQLTTWMTKEVYYYHCPSDQAFDSKDEVVQFVLDETCPPKHRSKKRKVVNAIESTHLVQDVVISLMVEGTLRNQDPSSTSNATTIKTEMSCDPEEIETGEIMSTEEMLNEFLFCGY